ncbi:MAG TPA: diaminopropionate ammonia-lyase [Baekduia sp.]|uniref:diaminopropionate ammonia-lyase n=1 Tax=Baekduia sp. TaxID=2600305 RepID=UPI002D7A11A0|nr:diaminopropionate ammonia-lyase [Baekduia sp.]HET6505378.1 diaminopropionate ammonia-lyase [Baekduia sp.]
MTLDHGLARESLFQEVSTLSPLGHRALERRSGRAGRGSADRRVDERVSAFHRSIPGYGPTRLIELDEIGRELGLERLWMKDETSRLGLPAFKILGASWAVHRALCRRLGLPDGDEAVPREAVTALLAEHPPCRFVTATDGNHGRAVARAAAVYGCRAHILVPAGTAAARIAAIAGEGATVEVWDGSYDDAVAAAAARADLDTIVLPDTATAADEVIPRWVADGYSTVFHEIDAELERRGEAGPDLVIVQIGVGALASAVVAHYRSTRHSERAPHLVGVEPLTAACVLETVAAGQVVEVPGPHPSVMAGLNAGLPSLTALPLIADGMDAFCAVSDDAAREAVRLLRRHGIEAGETGAAGLAGLLAVKREFPAICGGEIDDARRALLILTEGVTDPVTYEQALREVPRS